MRFSARCILVKFLIMLILLVVIDFIHHCIPNGTVGNTGPIVKNQVKHLKCEIIHIGVVWTDYDHNLHFYTMLKSLYYYRNNPLHLHIIVNDISEKLLKSMFNTWAVPQVNVSFYNIRTITSEFRRISENQYYLGIPSKLLKLTFPGAIATNITSKIIIIDADITFLSDVYLLWNLFDSFNEKQTIGLVEYHTSNNIKMDKGQSRLTHGIKQENYNTDITMYHLERLKTNGWTEMWFKSVNRAIASFGKTEITDQDVINKILDNNFDFAYFISSYRNAQLKYSYENYNNTKIKILSSPEKVTLNGTTNDNYYNQLYSRLLNYDGNLLRQQPYECSENLKSTAPVGTIRDNCSDFHEAETHQWRMMLFFREFKHNVTKDDITFVSQLSYGRRYVLEELSTLWKGPLSLTVYVTDSELRQFIEFIENSVFLKDRLNVAYHAVFKEGDNHPINELRNVALRQVITPYVFLVDIDFLPIPKLDLILKKHIGDLNNMSKKALIVPAFETQNYLPKTKNEVLEMLDNGTLFPFHQKVYHKAHAPTNYTKWRKSNETYEVIWKRNFEPYIIVQRNVTEYDKRFFGYGWNKVSHIMELRAQDYHFIVLPDAFIVHKHHKFSNDRYKFLRSLRQQRCLNKLKNRFIKELKKKYDRKSIT